MLIYFSHLKKNMFCNPGGVAFTKLIIVPLSKILLDRELFFDK